MTATTPSATQAKAHASRGIVYVARTGYAAHGVVYALLGLLALLSALGRGGGQTTDSKGALESLMGTPGGWVILVLVGVGLACYALWRGVQATLDPDDRGTDAKAIFKRIGYAISAFVNLALAFWAVRRGIGYASAGDRGNAREDWTAWLMSQPFGPWLVMAVGGLIIAAGVAQFVKGYKTKFTEHLDMSESLVHRLTPVCRFGLIARGVVFCIIGGFFLFAGWTYDSSKAGGLEQAFNTIRGVAFGQILLGIAALGMVAYAVYSFVEARYRRIRPAM